ncbi:MAG: hypothetical protein Q9167_002917 [Letrouitia subvulpina]
MPSYTSTQKAAIAQFTSLTQTKDSVAAKQLKSHNWNTAQAVDARLRLLNLPLKHSYFQSASTSTPPTPSNNTAALNKLFDKYRDNPTVEPDAIGIEGSMRYLSDLGLSLEDPVVFAILSELGAPTMGEMTRQGFVEGWQRHRAPDLPAQKSQALSFRRSLTSSPPFFRSVYKSTFRLALTPGQKSLALDTATEYWRILLSPPSLGWNTGKTPWLDWWIEYLGERWKKGVSRDMWEQTGVFVVKSLEDESMSWWSEDGAWPGSLDEFVAFVKEKRGPEGGSADGMEVE